MLNLYKRARNQRVLYVMYMLVCIKVYLCVCIRVCVCVCVCLFCFILFIYFGGRVDLGVGFGGGADWGRVDWGVKGYRFSIYYTWSQTSLS